MKENKIHSEFIKKSCTRKFNIFLSLVILVVSVHPLNYLYFIFKKILITIIDCSNSCMFGETKDFFINTEYFLMCYEKKKNYISPSTDSSVEIPSPVRDRNP